MSKRWIGAVISVTSPVTTGGEGGTAPGAWSLRQQMQRASAWPIQPPERQLWSWGKGTLGTLGLSNITSYSSPKHVGSGVNWKSVAVSYRSTVATKKDGTLWTWGRGADGVLGLGNTTDYSSPKQVGALTDWSSASISTNNRILAIKTNGTLWAWGYGAGGALGQGSQTSFSSPKQVGLLTDWAKISAGSTHAAAIKTSGALWTWGAAGSSLGQLGLNNTNYYFSPVQVGSLTTWATAIAGYNKSLFIKSPGTVWTCGRNSNGFLGHGNTTYYSSPTQVGALSTWSTASMGGSGILLTKTDGTLWGWGPSSAIGIGGYSPKFSSPVQSGALTTWGGAILSAYTWGSAVIKSDGSLWVWGYGTDGVLGLGNTTNYFSPKQLGSITSWTAITKWNAKTLGVHS